MTSSEEEEEEEVAHAQEWGSKVNQNATGDHLHVFFIFQRRNNRTRGTLAYDNLETMLCRVARLSNHSPPLLVRIIRPAFFLRIRPAFFLRLDVGPAATAVVLRVRRRFLRLDVGPAASAITLLRSLMSDTAMVLRARRRFLRLEVGPAASAITLLSSLMSDTLPRVGISLI